MSGGAYEGLFRRALRAPEIRLAALSLFFNGTWEFVQSPLYADHDRGVAYVVKTRLHCAVGDVLLTLFAFALTALVFRTRRWPWEGRIMPLVLFLLIGLGYTALSEWFHTRVALSWSYAPSMPRLLGLGAAPILQWFVTPIAILWALRRPLYAGIPSSNVKGSDR